MSKSNLLRTNAPNPGNSHAAVTAVAAILDNIVLHLTRHDLEKARPLAQMLICDRSREHSLCFDVLHTSALASALRRGLAQIKRLAPLSALTEFEQARELWSRENDDSNSVLETKVLQGSALLDDSLVAGCVVS
jgi:hypothetical protein